MHNHHLFISLFLFLLLNLIYSFHCYIDSEIINDVEPSFVIYMTSLIKQIEDCSKTEIPSILNSINSLSFNQLNSFIIDYKQRVVNNLNQLIYSDMTKVCKKRIPKDFNNDSTMNMTHSFKSYLNSSCDICASKLQTSNVDNCSAFFIFLWTVCHLECTLQLKNIFMKLIPYIPIDLAYSILLFCQTSETISSLKIFLNYSDIVTQIFTNIKSTRITNYVIENSYYTLNSPYHNDRFSYLRLRFELGDFNLSQIEKMWKYNLKGASNKNPNVWLISHRHKCFNNHVIDIIESYVETDINYNEFSGLREMSLLKIFSYSEIFRFQVIFYEYLQLLKSSKSFQKCSHFIHSTINIVWTMNTNEINRYQFVIACINANKNSALLNDFYGYNIVKTFINTSTLFDNNINNELIDCIFQYLTISSNKIKFTSELVSLLEALVNRNSEFGDENIIKIVSTTNILKNIIISREVGFIDYLLKNCLIDTELVSRIFLDTVITTRTIPLCAKSLFVNISTEQCKIIIKFLLLKYQNIYINDDYFWSSTNGLDDLCQYLFSLIDNEMNVYRINDIVWTIFLSTEGLICDNIRRIPPQNMPHLNDFILTELMNDEKDRIYQENHQIINMIKLMIQYYPILILEMCVVSVCSVERLVQVIPEISVCEGMPQFDTMLVWLLNGTFNNHWRIDYRNTSLNVLTLLYPRMTQQTQLIIKIHLNTAMSLRKWKSKLNKDIQKFLKTIE